MANFNQGAQDKWQHTEKRNNASYAKLDTIQAKAKSVTGFRIRIILKFRSHIF